MNTNKYRPSPRLSLGISLIMLLIILACGLPTETPPPCDPPPEGTISWMDGSTFVYVPGGDFLMGEDVTGSDAAPAHEVTLGSFWIQQTEVTNQMYAGCVSLGLCTAPKHVPDEPYTFGDPAFASDPVVGVDWQQAEDYCAWIQARLPSEAEWEYAARGAESRTYPWGEDEPTCDLLNYAGCQEEDQLRPVGYYLETESPFDTFDMAGNAFEWVHDWYAADYYEDSPSVNPPGPETGEERVFRSSSFNSPEEALPVFLRNHADPESFQADLGFRCVVELGTACNAPPPPCLLIGFYPPPASAEPPVVEVPPVEINGYCYTDPTGLQFATITVEFGEPISPEDAVVSTSAGTLICGQDSSFPTQLACSGPGLGLDTTVDVEVCREAGSLPELDPLCPTGYTFDAGTGMCANTSLTSTEGGNCPVGTPFNRLGLCCEYPNVPPTCPTDYSYNSASQTCQPPETDGEVCTTHTVTIPPCSPPDDHEPTLGCLYRPATGGPAQCAPSCPPNAFVIGTCELP